MLVTAQKPWIAKRAVRSAICVLAGVAAAGCGETGPTLAPLQSEVRDSAGVTIVDNEAPPATSRLDWGLASEPELSLGALDGAPEYQLFGVEDALRLDDGRILVANGGTSEIRVFDRAGVFQGAWGREGEGPGEFMGLTDLALWPGDSVLAWDFNQHRFTLFDLAGTPGRTQSLPLGDALGPGRLEGVLPDHSILTASQVRFALGEQTTGLVRRSREYVRVDSEGARLSSFGRHLDEEYYVRAELGAILRHPFRRSMHSAVWGDRIVISPSDAYEVRAYGWDGDLQVIVRGDRDVVVMTETDIEEQVADRLADADAETQALIRDLYEGMPPVDHFPAFSQLLVDAEGDLWVKDYARPGVDRSVWTVFDPDGRIRGLFETPPGLTVYRIGSDYILGRATDEFDVEYVQLWQLSREASEF